MLRLPTTEDDAAQRDAVALADEGTAAFDGLPGRFCMFFQPDADLATGALAGCEALLRWWHPDFGMLRPDLSLRGTRWDDTSRIEGWAASAVCEQRVEWDGLATAVPTALNVSRRYLLADGFIAAIDRAIESSGVDPAALALDVPVGALATDRDRVQAVTAALRDRGVTVVLDGVGIRTRLLAVERIPASVWKIDLWSAGRTSLRLHPAVLAARKQAERLGVTTIAKSVEDERALRIVRDAGFDRAFGHAISPAVTSRAMTALLRRPDGSRLID